MSLSVLAEVIDSSDHDLLSTDLFDTVLLRDHTIETARLATACHRAAPLIGADPVALTRLRWSLHGLAYRAVGIERPDGEASLRSICRAVALALGRGEDAARVLSKIEVDVDIEHLRPNRPLLDLLDRAGRSGMRVIALSDTYYDGEDLRRIVDAVVGTSPITAMYSSADVGLTKHTGRIFDEVARRENVPSARIVHVGDNYPADVQMARAARWSAVHLPRDGRHRATKFAGRVLALPVKLRSVR